MDKGFPDYRTRRVRLMFLGAVVGLVSLGAAPASGDPDLRWLGVGIDIVDEGRAAFAWDRAPGEPESYSVVFATPSEQLIIPVKASDREAFVSLSTPALHVAKEAWIVARYADGSVIRSESTFRDAVDLDGPPMPSALPDMRALILRRRNVSPGPSQAHPAQ